MATKVLPSLICVFALLVLSSRECDAFGVFLQGNLRPPRKVLFQEKDSLSVSKVILKITYALTAIGHNNYWYWSYCIPFDRKYRNGHDHTDIRIMQHYLPGQLNRLEIK